jgi:putative ABC transport system ATP-binding protein
MAEPMIRGRNLTKAYRRGSETLTVLDRLELDVARGEFCALMGPSGSGKTTLLNIVGALDHADSGDVLVSDDDLNAMSGAELSAWRARTVGFVFQGFNLIPVLSAYENVHLPLLLTPLGRAERKQHAQHALSLVGLAERAKHRPKQLSGGQEQRVAIARAIATDPDIILADEPTGDLDRESAGKVLDLLERLATEFGKTVLMVTHDPQAAERASRIVRVDKGRLVEDALVRPPRAAAATAPVETRGGA